MASSLWIVWTVIGIIGGYMTGRLVDNVRSVALAVCVGICGALLGGWLLLLALGTGQSAQAFSLASSAVGCAIFLWVLALAMPRRRDDDND